MTASPLTKQHQHVDDPKQQQQQRDQIHVLSCLLIMVSTIARVSVCDLDPRDLRLPGNTFFVHFLPSFFLLHLLFFFCGYRSVTQGPYRHGKLRAVPTLRYIYKSQRTRSTGKKVVAFFPKSCQPATPQTLSLVENDPWIA